MLVGGVGYKYLQVYLLLLLVLGDLLKNVIKKLLEV